MLEFKGVLGGLMYWHPFFSCLSTLVLLQNLVADFGRFSVGLSTCKA